MDAQDQNNREDFKCTEPQEFTSTHDTPPPGLLHEPPEPPAGNVSDPERDIDPDLHKQQLDLEPNELELVSEEKPEFSEAERKISEVEPEINNNNAIEDTEEVEQPEPAYSKINNDAIEDTEDVKEPVPAYSKINDDDFTTVELDGKSFHSFKPCVHLLHLIITDVCLQVLENGFEVGTEAT